MAALPAVPPPPQVLQRRRHRMLVLAAIVVFLCGLVFLYLLAALGSSLFITEFRLVNDSGEDLRVTSVGQASNSRGPYVPLRTVGSRWAPLTRRRACRLPLQTGQSLAFVWDGQEVAFRLVLIEDGRGNVFAMDTDRVNGPDMRYGNRQGEYRIPPLSKLPRAPAELLPLLEGKWIHYSGAREYEQRRFLPQPHPR